MNKRERQRINSILDQANTLMDAGPNDKVQITNADVVEAILGDLLKFLNNSEPSELAKLVAQDSRESKIDTYAKKHHTDATSIREAFNEI